MVDYFMPCIAVGGPVEEQLHAQVAGGLLGAGDAGHVVGVALGLGQHGHQKFRVRGGGGTGAGEQEAGGEDEAEQGFHAGA